MATFDVQHLGLRNAQALTCLLMLLNCAALIALMIGMMLVRAGQRSHLDWHQERGLSFLQMASPVPKAVSRRRELATPKGLRELARLCYQRLPLPKLQALPKDKLPPASASHRN